MGKNPPISPNSKGSASEKRGQDTRSIQGARARSQPKKAGDMTPGVKGRKQAARARIQHKEAQSTT